jgi:hypothetical protein
MAIIVRNTNYSGEVLEQLLTLAATSNEIVEKGLIMVIPGVEKKISLPRLKTGKMLQKRKENPGVEDSKGNFNYDEKSLDPVDFMAFTVFNPRTFENIWRKWQRWSDTKRHNRYRKHSSSFSAYPPPPTANGVQNVTKNSAL